MSRLSRATSALLLNASFIRVARPLLRFPHPPVSRSVFLGQGTAAISTCLSLKDPSSGPMDAPISLLDSVYGPVDDPGFPLPMPEGEAGPCADGQRRYLWTDAFGVLAFVSIAEAFEQDGKIEEAQKYRSAVDKLVMVVHRCLGAPRSEKRSDAMKEDKSSPTGFVGLRIGKVETRPVTDYGMHFDGQYWHYVDKWLLALARSGHVEEGIGIAKSCFPYFFDPGDGTGRGGGIRWKLSVDSSAPPPLQYANVSDDDLVALIVFSILESSRKEEMPSLVREIKMLRTALKGYRPRVTDDPLGWGLEALYDQFIQGNPRRSTLAAIHSTALHPSHLSLPFRLYGAIIGARIAGESVAPKNKVDKLIQMSLEHEAHAAATGKEEHSSINRVMLSMCILCPGSLGRRPGDPLLELEK